MSEKKLVGAGTLKKGNYIIIEDVACKVTDIKVSRPGKHGHAKVNITAAGLLDDKKRNIVMPGHDSVEVPVVDKRSAQVLSITGKMASIMDGETFETFEMEIPDELKSECIEGCSILYWDILGDRVMKQIKTE